MELRHIRYFEAVARTLNFTKASELLHIAQPALSRQIQQLEEELGVALINRSSRPLRLTHAGTFFFEQSVQLLGRLQEVRKATQRLGAGQRRWMGIGFTPSLLYGDIPKVIQGFMDAHPDVDVLLSEMTSIVQAEALKAGRIDVGFGRLAPPVEGVVHRRLLEERLIAAVPAASELAASASLSLCQLAREQLVIYPAQPRPSFADHVMEHFNAHGCRVARTFEANGVQTAIGLVAAGIGFTVVPESVQRLKRDDIAYRPISDMGVTSPMIMSTRDEEPSDDVRNFCDAVLGALAESRSSRPG